jgi:Spy/CpxP family protein refolding chaperone
MSAMQELMSEAFDTGNATDAEAKKNYEAMAALRKQMFETSLDARKRIEAVLTKEQRDKLHKESRRGWGPR